MTERQIDEEVALAVELYGKIYQPCDGTKEMIQNRKPCIMCQQNDAECYYIRQARKLLAQDG
jgi:hypothetical protein